MCFNPRRCKKYQKSNQQKSACCRNVDFIEFDVRLTSDGKLVLSHDNKAPDGTIISEATYDEIVAKTFTYHVDTTSSLFESASEGFIRARNEELDGKEYSIIGLREAVEACKDKKILIDIKFEHDIPELTRELVRELSGVDKSNIVFQSLNAEGIKYLNQHKKTYVISQEASTCVVYGMPKAVEQGGLANEVAPLKSVANSIVKRLGG